MADDPAPWYAASGLRFRCTGCGACCRQPGFVYLHNDEADRIARRLRGADATAESLAGAIWAREDADTFVIEVRAGSACPLLGPEGCTVHDIKPMQCATYPFWPELLESPSAWHEEATLCEGISPLGDLYRDFDVRRLVKERARTHESSRGELPFRLRRPAPEPGSDT